VGGGGRKGQKKCHVLFGWPQKIKIFVPNDHFTAQFDTAITSPICELILTSLNLFVIPEFVHLIVYKISRTLRK
jgi:hypothetical protein